MKSQNLLLFLIFTAILGAGLIITLAKAGLAYAKDYYPLITADTSAYFEVEQGFFKQHRLLVTDILKQVSDLDIPANIGQTGDKLGFAIINQEIIWFSHNQAGQYLYQVPAKTRYNLVSLFKKQKLTELAEKTSNFGLINNLYAQISQENNTLIFSARSDLQMIAVGGELAIEPVTMFNLQANTPLPWVILVKEQVLNEFWQKLDTGPLDLVVKQGNSHQLFTEPFSEQTEFTLQAKLEQSEAQQILEQVLRQFTDKYPQIIKRVLPDNSSVFELRRAPEQFLSVGQNQLDLAANPQGLITYPLGQVRYNYENQALTVEKLSSLSTNEATVNEATVPISVDNYCDFSNSLISGYASSSFLSTTMWKSLNFALDKQNIVLCVSY